MKKKVFSLVLAFLVMLSLGSSVFAASDEAVAAANALYELGLFRGTGTDENGNPIFDLDRAPTRHEAVTMLVRLLGKEAEATAGTWTTPFTDVAEWAKPYVGYAYTHGLTNGMSDTTFGGDNIVSAAQYLTFVLRALGYQSGSDFQWDKAWELSDQLGITNGQYNANSEFLRGDVAVVSYKSLSAPKKEETLDLQGYWYGLNYPEGGKIGETYFFDGNNYSCAYVCTDSKNMVLFAGYEEGTFSVKNGVLTLIRTVSYVYEAGDDTTTVDETKKVLEYNVSREDQTIRLNDWSYKSTATAESEYNRAKQYVMEKFEAQNLDLQGYWIGTNYVEGGKFVESYYFNGNKYSCAYSCLDSQDRVMFTGYEEGTFTFKDGVLTLTRTVEYIYGAGYAKTKVGHTREVFEYRVSQSGSRILFDGWGYERSEYAEPLYHQFKDYVMKYL